MKKLIAGLTTTALIASLSAPAFAANFDDVKGTSSEKAVGMLKALGIVNGDGGNYNPNATITRAEFAKIAVNVAGLGAAAAAYGINANTGFSDVPAGHWAAGYVAVAQAAGLVKGYGDGTFGTDDNVTYEQVVTVMERILGFNDNLPGGYPNGYVVKGAALSLTGNVQFAVGKAATRGDVAIISQATLNTVEYTYSKDSNSFSTVISGLTLLSDKFANNSTKAVLSETSNSVGTSLKAGQVKIGGIVYTTNADTIVVGGSLDSLVGHSVTVIADSTYNNASYIADASATTNVITGALNVSTTPVTVSGSVYQVSVGGTKYNLATSPVSFFNGANVTSTGLNATTAADGDAATVVLDKFGNAQFVGVKHYESPVVANTDGVVKTTANDAVVSYNGGNVYLVDSTVITRNGQAASVTDIKKGDVLYWTKSTSQDANLHNYATNLDVYSTKKTGTFQSYAADGTTLKSVTIDGTTYSVNSSFGLTTTGLPATNTTIDLTLDKDGKVAAIATSASTAVASNYFVEKVASNVYQLVGNTVIPSTQVTLLGSDGKVVTKYVAKQSDGVTDVTTVSVAQGNVYSLTFDTTGNVSKSTALTAGVAYGAGYQLGSTDVSSTNKTIKVSGNTYNVLSNTLFVDDSASSTDFTKAAGVTFDKIQSGQFVRVVVDPTNVGNVLAVLVDTSTGISTGLSRQSGIYTGKYTTYDGTTTTQYVTLNVNGASQSFKLNATNTLGTPVAGDAVYLSDVDNALNGDGTYDTVNAGTQVTTVAKDVYMTNGFTINNLTATKYVYNNNTKVYIVTMNGAVRTTTYTVGTLSDFTQYLNNPVGAPAMQLTTTGSNVGGYQAVDAVVIYR